DASQEAITTLFTEICAIEEPADGIAFDPATLRVEPTREEDEYQGAKLTVHGILDRARITVQVDIGFGDRVYPAAERAIFPSLLPELPAADVLMYPPETVVAEK